ncbi:hypothetical protein [Ignavibacterium album]|uniref:hypothetical protein n=1 Tax=Ignavibacterium album TaxID=591197 RepID=UPI0035BB1C3C
MFEYYAKGSIKLIPYFLYSVIPTPIHRRRNLFTMKVYDLLSFEVLTIVDEYREAGRYMALLNW